MYSKILNHILFIALFVPMLLVSSCSKDDDGDGLSSMEKQIVGVWENMNKGGYYSFYPDYKAKVTFSLGGSAYYTGAWKLNGNRITVIFNYAKTDEVAMEWIADVVVSEGTMKFIFDDYERDFKKVANIDTDTSIPSDAIDLGLSVRWAKCNLGASSPEEFGYHLKWGSTTVGGSGLSNHYGSIVGTSNDAAHVKLGKKWRLPSRQELEELVEECVWTFTSKKGTTGYNVTGPSGNSIFLPAAGRVSDKSESNTGYYWSGEHYGYSSYCASIRFTDDWYRVDSDMPNDGLSIRPVFGDL